MDDNKAFLAKHMNTVKKLYAAPAALNEFRILYNNLCTPCKAKVLRQPRMPLEKYCKICSERAKLRMENVKGMI